MTGHFFQTDVLSSTEKLFIARCEALVSPSTKVANPQQTLMASNNDTSKSLINLTLNEDMSIDSVSSKYFFLFLKTKQHVTFFFSSSMKNVLGYTKNEMVGNWLGRYVATDDLHKFEALPQKFCKKKINIMFPSYLIFCFYRFSST